MCEVHDSRVCVCEPVYMLYSIYGCVKVTKCNKTWKKHNIASIFWLVGNFVFLGSELFRNQRFYKNVKKNIKQHTQGYKICFLNGLL